MAWTNILDIAGLTLQVDLGAGFGATVAPADIASGITTTPVLDVAGNTFAATYASGNAGWQMVELKLIDAGALTLPCNIRGHIDYVLVIPGGTGGDGIIWTGTFSSSFTLPEVDGTPESQDANGVLNALNDILLFATFSGSGEYFGSIALTVEVDGDIATPDIWTDFVGCLEV